MSPSLRSLEDRMPSLIPSPNMLRTLRRKPLQADVVSAGGVPPALPLGIPPLDIPPLGIAPSPPLPMPLLAASGMVVGSIAILMKPIKPTETLYPKERVSTTAL